MKKILFLILFILIIYLISLLFDLFPKKKRFYSDIPPSPIPTEILPAQNCQSNLLGIIVNESKNIYCFVKSDGEYSSLEYGAQPFRIIITNGGVGGPYCKIDNQTWGNCLIKPFYNNEKISINSFYSSYNGELEAISGSFVDKERGVINITVLYPDNNKKINFTTTEINKIKELLNLMELGMAREHR